MKEDMNDLYEGTLKQAEDLAQVLANNLRTSMGMPVDGTEYMRRHLDQLDHKARRMRRSSHVSPLLVPSKDGKIMEFKMENPMFLFGDCQDTRPYLLPNGTINQERQDASFKRYFTVLQQREELARMGIDI